MSLGLVPCDLSAMKALYQLLSQCFDSSNGE